MAFIERKTRKIRSPYEEKSPLLLKGLILNAAFLSSGLKTRRKAKQNNVGVEALLAWQSEKVDPFLSCKHEHAFSILRERPKPTPLIWDGSTRKIEERRNKLIRQLTGWGPTIDFHVRKRRLGFWAPYLNVEVT